MENYKTPYQRMKRRQLKERLLDIVNIVAMAAVIVTMFYFSLPAKGE